MCKPTYCLNKQRNFASAFSLLFLLLISLTSHAASPGNDDCSAALVIPGQGPFPYILPAIEITDATTTNDPTQLPQCQTDVARSIWFSFTPTNSEFYTFSTCPDETTVKDTVLAIYTNALGCSSPDTFGLVACADDSAGGCLEKAVLTAPLLSNVTYYVIAWQWSHAQITPGNSSIRLMVSKTLPPPNDTCANAQPLALNMPVYGSTLAANDDYETIQDLYSDPSQLLSSSASGRDVVYSFTAPVTDTYSVRVYDYSSDPNDLVLYATSICPAEESPYTFDSVLAVANRTSGFGASTEELFCVPLGEGQRIYIVVDEDFLINGDGVLSAGSTFRIEVNRCRVEQEDNGSPDTASALPCGVEGGLGTGNEDDYYSLGTFPAGSRVFALIDSSAATPTGFGLQIRTNTTTSTNLLQHSQGNSPEVYGYNSANLAGTILPELPVFARVFDPAKQAKEPYRFFAVIQPPIEMANWESEPNNTYDTATSATNNYDYFRGSFANSSDVDVFRFTARGGDLIFVSLDCDPLRNATPIMGRLELLDADGKSLLNVDTTDSGTTTNSSDTGPASLSTGFYYRVADEGEFEFFVRVSIGYTSGDYLLSISKNCFARASGANTAPVLTNLSDLPAALEGETVPLSGHIVDPDTGEAFTVLVNWGDGSEPETIQPGPGVYDFAASHLYADSGNFPVSLTVTDNNGGSVVSNLTTVINNIAPSVTALEATTGTILEGGSFSLNGTFSDPGVLDTHTVAINWGDGSQLETINRGAGVYDFAASHTYADNGSFEIILTISDNNGGSVVSNLAAVVNNAAPTIAALQTPTGAITEGSSFALSGTIADPGVRDTHTVAINWGDGSQLETINRSAGVYDFASSHTYADNGSFSITLTLSDNDGGSVVSNLTAVVTNAAPSVTALSATPGAFTEGSSVTLSGTIADAGIRDTHTVLVNWGDGSSASTLNLAVGETSFAANHSYVDDNPTGTVWDRFSIAVTVTDNDSGTCSSNTSVVVSNLPPVFTSATLAPATILPNQSANLSVAFTDAGASDTFTYSVNWGDGSAVETHATAQSFNLTHVFALANTNLSVNVTIQDDDGGSVSTNLPISIEMPASPRLSLTVSNGWYWVQVQGDPNVTYRLQGSTNLPSWNDLVPLILDTNGVAGVKITNSFSVPPHFFRAVFP